MMNFPLLKLSQLAVTGVMTAVLFAVPVVLNSTAVSGFISLAHAAETGDTGGHKGAMGANKGGQGQKGAGGPGETGGKKGMSKVLEADDGSDDSDRPEWAMGNKQLNPHRGDPNPTPGVKKGEDYGDLYVIVRDPVTGAPVLIDGEYQICLDAGCSETVLTVDGEVPEGVAALEIDFGRASAVRSPEKVSQHALDELIKKLEASSTVTLDPSGRLVIDGVTVDSPLENLALYIALLGGDPKLTEAIINKLPDNTMDLAASLLAGGADKTGTISIDFVVYMNVVAGITQNDTYYDYTDFSYDRSDYDVTYDYNYQSGDQVLSATVNLKDFLEATQPALSDAEGVTLFSIAADDALQVIELIHTQIQDALLPGTVTP
jgi:hypothetical protein